MIVLIIVSKNIYIAFPIPNIKSNIFSFAIASGYKQNRLLNCSILCH